MSAKVPQPNTKKKPEKKLTRVGIYVTGNLLRNPNFAFARTLYQVLNQQLTKENITKNAWVDPRPSAIHDQPWSELIDAVAEKRFQALIVPNVTREMLNWLEKLEVPVVYLTSADIPNRVSNNLQQGVNAAVQLLAEQGCRRIGAICTFHLPKDGSVATHPGNLNFFDSLKKSSKKLNLELRPEWIISPEKPFTTDPTELPLFGFYGMQTLWRQSEHPEGIIVEDDVTASGVLMGVMSEKIRVPGDLKLVLFRNKEIEIFCPIPTSFIDIHVNDIAAALITQAKKLHNGEQVSPIKVKYRPVASDSETGNNSDIHAKKQ